AAPIISDWHVDDWMERMQRMIPAKKPHFGNSPFRGNDRNSCGNDRNSCGNDRNSCGNDRNSCGNDRNSCGNDRNSRGNDRSKGA
ncbi:MAG: hypothetical protein NTX52_07510, partial [Planctomycetota bacterium]|nr:hypothetical protein [Planctomycetota bacterium]